MTLNILRHHADGRHDPSHDRRTDRRGAGEAFITASRSLFLRHRRAVSGDAGSGVRSRPHQGHRAVAAHRRYYSSSSVCDRSCSWNARQRRLLVQYPKDRSATKCSAASRICRCASTCRASFRQSLRRRCFSCRRRLRRSTRRTSPGMAADGRVRISPRVAALPDALCVHDYLLRVLLYTSIIFNSKRRRRIQR